MGGIRLLRVSHSVCSNITGLARFTVAPPLSSGANPLGF